MVRLHKEPFWTRRTIVSFGSCVSAGLIIILLWWLWPRRQVELAYQRDVREVMVLWRCPAGHGFEARGRVDRMVCPNCGKPAEIEWKYECPDHGPILLQVRYRLTPKGRTALDRFSLDGETWKSIDEGLRCPQCEKPLRRD